MAHNVFNQLVLLICHLSSYESILKSLGNNLHDFLANLDYLHEHLSMVFVGMRAPSFRVTHSTDGTMHLLYHSERKGMAPFVRGLVMTVAMHFFKTEVIVNQLNKSDESPILFEVINKSVSSESSFEKIKTPFTDSTLSASPNHLFFSVETLNETLPFHFIFKRNFRIIEMGHSLRRYVPKDINFGPLTKDKKIMFSDMFIIIKPIIELNFEAVVTFSNHLFLLQTREPYVKGRGKENSSDLRHRIYTLEREVEQPVRLTLKGQMISLPAFDAILFLGSPKVEDTDEMAALNLTMTDFPVYDQTGRHIMTRATRGGDQGIIGKIDEAANHLKIVEKKLRLEISKNHKILNEIFPVKIARILTGDGINYF